MDQILKPTMPEDYEVPSKEKVLFVNNTFRKYYENGKGPLAQLLMPLTANSYDFIIRRTIHLWDGIGGQKAVYELLKAVTEDMRENFLYSGIKGAFKYSSVNTLDEINSRLSEKMNEIINHLLEIYALKRDLRDLIRHGRRLASNMGVEYKGIRAREIENLVRILNVIEEWRFWKWIPPKR
jgi:hypothetical protein